MNFDVEYLTEQLPQTTKHTWSFIAYNSEEIPFPIIIQSGLQDSQDQKGTKSLVAYC